MALNGFSVLLLVSAALEVLAELKRAFYTALCPLILRLKLLHNAIENKVYYDLAAALYYFSNKETKEIDKPEVIGEAKGGRRGQGVCLPQLKCHQRQKGWQQSLLFIQLQFFFYIFAYYSNCQ